MDCLPVLGQLMLRLVRSARFFGRVFPSYKSATLCFSIGPSFKITETAMSCVPPHLLQRATILYRAAELFVVSGIASCMPSFSCMRTRIVRCFGHSVKDKERAILATRPVANKFKNRICIFVALWICEKISRHSVCHFLRYAKSCVTNPLTENIRFRPNLLSGKQFWKSVWALRDTVHGLR
jgi:hypothetical protein